MRREDLLWKLATGPAGPCRLVRRLFAAVVSLWLACSATAAPPSTPLVLDAASPLVEAWPAITMLADPSHAWTLDEVLSRRAEFGTPQAAHANLGVRPEAVWLRFEVDVAPGSRPRWLLDLNYPSLARIDAYVLQHGVVQAQARLGEEVPFRQRVIAARSHAMPLLLSAGQAYEILLRIETSSSMVLPISLVREERFHADEARIQMIQGLLTGVGLCLIVYSLAQWLSVRDPVFIHYSAVVFGTTLFFFVHFGLAQQHLWPDRSLLNLSPAAALIAQVGGFLFTERVLGIRSLNPRLGRAMVLGSMLAASVTLAFVSGLLSYHAAQVAATLLGPWPLLLALHPAFVRARRGERVPRYVLVGWTVFALSTIAFVGLLRGWVPANVWTRHVFQFGALFEMCVWMRVLGVRSGEIRRAARRLNLERDAMRLLAHTDALTGLPNRRGLSDAAQAALRRCTGDKQVALYMLDLDGFKSVNDRLGHEAGDDLLVAVARRLKSAVRASDLVARLGGDEFVVMAEGLAGDAEAQRLGQKLLNEFRVAFDVAGQSCRMGLTIGYVLAPPSATDVAALLKQADAAMYSGKQAGRHCMRRATAPAGLAEA